MNIIESFAITIILSFQFYPMFTSEQHIGYGLFKLTGYISLGLLLILFGVDKSLSPIWFFAFFLPLAGQLLFPQKKYLYIAGLFLMLLYLLLFRDLKLSVVPLVLSSLFSGGIIYAMILGHWYLVIPKLSELHLLRVLKIIGMFMVPYMVNLAVNHYSWMKLDIDTFTGVLLGLNLLWMGPLLIFLGGVTWKLVKMRSIQSATGVLYVMVFFLLMGELIHKYLESTLGAII